MRMRPAVAALIAAVASAAVVAATLTSTSTASAVTATAARISQSGVTHLSAPIVQPGRSRTSSEKASLSGTVRFRPAYQGRRVVIQRRVVHQDGSTTKWKRVATRREDRRGVVSFTGRAHYRGNPFEYRGVALRYRGHRKVNATPESAAVWQPVFTDEFSGRGLGDQWADRPAPTTSRKCSIVGDSRASDVRFGTLRLQVKRNPDKRRCRIRSGPNRGRYRHYLNGAVSTQPLGEDGDFQYGTFSARIKFPKGRGQHGGFWLQPTKGQSDEGSAGASGAEIDVVEFFGKGYQKGGLASFLYNYHILRRGEPVKIGGMQPDATRMLGRRDTWWTRYHVFTVEWTPHWYSFQVDGRQHMRTKRGVSRIPEYLILSQLTSDWELRQAKRLGIRPGGTMYVDWARVWQR